MIDLRLNYSEIAKALELFIVDEIHGAGFKKVILGLSGGIDSAIVAFLAQRALGNENVFAVLMPYKTSSEDSLSHAKLVVDQLKIKSETKPITVSADSYFLSTPEMTPLRKGNVMARLRMITLYDLSVRENALVIGTSNKTELMLGYGTQFGDMASALNPIGDLYKTQIWQLSEFLGVPKEIIEKQPSADLWIGQTDEQEMGFSYANADQILYQMIDLRLSDDEIIFSGYEKETVLKIRKMVIRSQYKRKLPLIAKLTTRTVGIDFHYPRDWRI